MYAITNVVDDDSLSSKAKEIIKYINTHDGIIDKLFLDIFTDLSNLYGDLVSKNDENDTISVNVTLKNADSVYTDIMQCVEHHINRIIPNKYQSGISAFLYRLVYANSTTIQLKRKK